MRKCPCCGTDNKDEAFRCKNESCTEILPSPGSPERKKETISNKNEGKKIVRQKFIDYLVITLAIVVIASYFTIPRSNTGQKASQAKAEQDLSVFQNAIDASRSRFVVTDCNASSSYIGVTVKPKIIFSSRYEIEQTVDNLVRIMNNAFPGRGITVRLQESLNNGFVRKYGESYIDLNGKVETKSY